MFWALLERVAWKARRRADAWDAVHEFMYDTGFVNLANAAVISNKDHGPVTPFALRGRCQPLEKMTEMNAWRQKSMQKTGLTLTGPAFSLVVDECYSKKKYRRGQDDSLTTLS